MAKNYETERRMRGAAVGTILPWVGDASTVPDGWLQCNGQTLEGSEYPMLASVIGNTYGPPNGLNSRVYPNYLLGDRFRLPSLNGRLLADYETEYLDNDALLMGQVYASGAIGGINVSTGGIDPARADGVLNLTGLSGSSGGTGLALSLSVDNTGNTTVIRIGDANGNNLGTGFAADETVTIPTSSFTAKSGNTLQEDLVLVVGWILPSVADVLTPTGVGAVQLMGGDGSGNSPPTSANATADINFTVTDSANLTGQIRNFSINPPTFFDSLYVVPRKLSKDHMASHRHIANAADPFLTAAADGGYVEAFQCPNINGATEGNDKEKLINQAEDSIASTSDGYAFLTRYQDGVTLVNQSNPQKSTYNSVGLTGAEQPVWSGPIPRPLGATWNGTSNSLANRRESNQGFLANYKNWYGNLTADQVANASGASLTYGTTLNHKFESHTQQGSHNHFSFELSMNAGFLRPPTIVPVNNIQVDSTLSGTSTNVAAQNVPSALNINVDIKTPALSMMYLIRAY